MGQRISRLPALNRLRKRRDVRPGDQITVLVGIVDFKIRLRRIANRVVGLGTNLLLRELQRADG